MPTASATKKTISFSYFDLSETLVRNGKSTKPAARETAVCAAVRARRCLLTLRIARPRYKKPYGFTANAIEDASTRSSPARAAPAPKLPLTETRMRDICLMFECMNENKQATHTDTRHCLPS